MILGRTSSGAIKIKTDTAGGGLRAVECACCEAGCKRFRVTLLGFTFEVSPTGMNAGIPFQSNDGRGFRCEYSGSQCAGDLVTYKSGTDFYCDGGFVMTTQMRTGGCVGVILTHYIDEGVVALIFTYAQSLDPAGERECVQAFFCTRGTETFNRLYYEGEGEFPAQNGTHSVPSVRTESSGCCPWSPDYTDECSTFSQVTTAVSVGLEIIT